MRYAGAGHPPMLQWRQSTGKSAKIMENGLVLGMVAEATYEALEFPLEPGDRYALYTDGILEADNAEHGEYGADRFMRFMEDHKHLAAEPFSQAFLAGNLPLDEPDRQTRPTRRHHSLGRRFQTPVKIKVYGHDNRALSWGLIPPTRANIT